MPSCGRGIERAGIAGIHNPKALEFYRGIKVYPLSIPHYPHQPSLGHLAYWSSSLCGKRCRFKRSMQHHLV
jgi:hypothetical protein